MNYIKLKTISAIKNSELKQKDKEFFIDTVSDLSDKNTSKILQESRKSKDALKLIWGDLSKKFVLISKIIKSEYLSEDQKNILKNVVINDLDSKDVEKILKNEEIDLDAIDDDNEKMKKFKLDSEEKFNSISKKIKEVLDKKIKKAEGEAIKSLEESVKSH